MIRKFLISFAHSRNCKKGSCKIYTLFLNYFKQLYICCVWPACHETKIIPSFLSTRMYSNELSDDASSENGNKTSCLAKSIAIPFQSHSYLMEKDFRYTCHPTHQPLDHERPEETIAFHFLLVSMKMHDFLTTTHPFLQIDYANFLSKIELTQNRMVGNLF